MYQVILGGVEGPLGLKHVEEVGLSLRVELGGKLHSLLIGRHCLHQCLPVLLFSCGHDEGVLHFLERRQDSLLIRDQGLFLQCLFLGDL